MPSYGGRPQNENTGCNEIPEPYSLLKDYKLRQLPEKVGGGGAGEVVWEVVETK